MNDQSKIIVDNYQYISYLVYKIQDLYQKKEDYNWYFEQFIQVYFPLIQSKTKAVHQRIKSKASFMDIKTRILEILFLAIIKYNRNFANTENNNNNFAYVFFSRYLNQKIGWDVMRIYKPTKVEHDDFSVDPRNIELNLKKLNTEVQDRFECHNVQLDPISDNFVSLCCMAQKQLKNDMLSDIMFLHFGCDYKNNEMAKLFEVQPIKISLGLKELKKYWIKNVELIRED